MLTQDNPRLIFRDLDDPAGSWEDSMARAVAERITEVYWYTRGAAELPELLAAIPMLVGRAVEVHGGPEDCTEGVRRDVVDRVRARLANDHGMTPPALDAAELKRLWLVDEAADV